MGKGPRVPTYRMGPGNGELSCRDAAAGTSTSKHNARPIRIANVNRRLIFGSIFLLSWRDDDIISGFVGIRHFRHAIADTRIGGRKSKSGKRANLKSRHCLSLIINRMAASVSAKLANL